MPSTALVAAVADARRRPDPGQHHDRARRPAHRAQRAEAGGLSGPPLRDPDAGGRGARPRARAGDRLAIIASGGIVSAEDVAAAYAAGRRPGPALDGPRLPRAGADRRGRGGEARTASDTMPGNLARGAGRTRRSASEFGTDDHRDLPRRGCPRFGAAHPHRAARAPRPGAHRARRGRRQPQPDPRLSAGRRVGQWLHRDRCRRQPLPRLRGRHRGGQHRPRPPERGARPSRSRPIG